MNLMFWKKTAGPGEETENALEDTAANTKPGVAARMKLQLAALARRFKKTPVSDVAEGDEEEAHSRSKATHNDDSVEDTSEIKPARSKKRLVIGGVISLLVLLLGGIGLALWPAATPHQEQLDTGHDVAITNPIPPAPGEPQVTTTEKSQSEIEALKKENTELHARIEALKNELLQQQSSGPAARHAGGNAPSSSASSEMMAGNKDSKATAMTLKEAIEAMNASSGNHAKKSAK